MFPCFERAGNADGASAYNDKVINSIHSIKIGIQLQLRVKV